MIQFGNDKIKDIYVGSDTIKEVYYGSEQVWGEIESIQEGYWVHKDTGVKTYFDLDDPSIENGIMSSPSWWTSCSEVNIPVGVTGTSSYCFAGCTALTSITIPDSVTTIGSNCFYNCTALTSIYSLRGTAPSLGINPFGGTSANYAGRKTYNQGVNRLYVPQGATGYNAGYWLDPLQNVNKCGFTISYTL